MTNEKFTWLQPGAWRKPIIVHATMVAKDRRPLFGKLSHDGRCAVIEKSPIGWILIKQQQRMLELCPEVKILADKVMPDHHHMVLQVMRYMRRSIKEVVRGYMQGCKAEALKLGFDGNIYDAPPFYRVLSHKGQLKAMIEYVYANAERAWQRKQNPDLFRIHRQTEICGLTFTSLGNHFLLNWPDRQFVEMSRSSTDEKIKQRLQYVLTAAQNGAVTYTAAISRGEQVIARTLREQGMPLIVLLSDGFPGEGSPHEKYYKPGGLYFESCSKGDLLLLEPTTQTITSQMISTAAEKTLRQKAEEKHIAYQPVSASTQRYRFVVLNEIGKFIIENG